MFYVCFLFLWALLPEINFMEGWMGWMILSTTVSWQYSRSTGCRLYDPAKKQK